MSKYRKKPVVVEAIRFINTEDRIKEIKEFIGDSFEVFVEKRMLLNYIPIATLEGVMMAKEGDYIIKGVNGEFYPCKFDIFNKTYESVE